MLLILCRGSLCGDCRPTLCEARVSSIHRRENNIRTPDHNVTGRVGLVLRGVPIVDINRWATRLDKVYYSRAANICKVREYTQWCRHPWHTPPHRPPQNVISMAQWKTALFLLLTQWKYCSLAFKIIGVHSIIPRPLISLFSNLVD